MDPRQSTEDFDYIPIKSPSEKKQTWDVAGDDIPRQRTGDILQRTSWHSELFKVQRKTQPSWQHSDYYKYRIFSTTKWIIVPIFLLFGIATIISFVLYFIDIIAETVGFAILLGINIIGGLLGAIMVYKYGTIEQVIDFMALQNQWYETEMESLSKHRGTIAKEARSVHFTVNKLKVCITYLSMFLNLIAIYMFCVLLCYPFNCY